MPAYMPVASKPRIDREFQEQAALFSWARNPAVVRLYPELRLMSCSLNGVKLSKAQAGKAKAAGMLKGEHDVCLPVARGGYTGLSIEMKVGKNRPTQDQLDYGHLLAAEGWCVRYCWSWEEARNEIMLYLMQDRTCRIRDGYGSISAPSGKRIS